MTRTASESFDPQLLRTLRAAPWRTIEKRFALILVGSIAFHVAFAGYLAAQPTPVAQEHLDELQDRFAGRVTLPPLLPIPRTLPVVTAVPSVATAAPVRVPTRVVDPRKVAQDAVIRVLGSKGPGGVFGALLDGPVDEIAKALEGAKGVAIIANIDPAGPRGPAAGQTATIDRLGTDGVKKVGIGTRLDKGPATAVPGPISIDDTDDIDPRVLQQFIMARRSAVQHCYEREIHHNPSMKGGKVVLRMAIGTGGRVSGVSIEEDTLASQAVTACMSTLMKRWIFPVAPKDEISVSLPFVFARAN